MTETEKHRVAEVLATADGGCPNCVTDIAEEMTTKFPDDDWFKRVMRVRYPDKDWD